MAKTIHKLKLYKQRFHFSAAHFTIFSSSDREMLHGHNYYLKVELRAKDEDIFSDYNIAKNHITDVCESLNEKTLIPDKSPHLKIKKTASQVTVIFNTDTISLPCSDVYFLPIRNTTIEEVSKFVADKIFLKLKDSYEVINIELSSGPGQSCIQEFEI